jgi:hypothetical protein
LDVKKFDAAFLEAFSCLFEVDLGTVATPDEGADHFLHGGFDVFRHPLYGCHILGYAPSEHLDNPFAGIVTISAKKALHHIKLQFTV